MTNALNQLARHVVETRFEDLSPAAIAATKTFCLDTLGVCVAGTSATSAENIIKVAESWGSGNEAAVIGLGDRFPATTAAFINGFHTHNQEYDCVHELAVLHPLTTIQSAVLAYGSRHGGISGRDMILALVLGVDVATSIGMAAQTSVKFFRPATAGIFGVAAAIGKLAGLDCRMLMDAFGLAYAQAAGTMQAHVEGGPSLALMMGFAAAAGIRAVDLAQAGFTGSHDVLEGTFGYFRLYEGAWDTEQVWAELGRVWRITQVSHKPFPSGRATHGGIDSILQLRAAHGLQADELDTLTLSAPTLIHELVGRPLLPDMTVNYARLCFQYVGALALTNGQVDMGDFCSERLRDESLHALAQQIKVVIDDNPDPNALSPQKVIAVMKDGREFTVEIPHTLGSPQRPLTREEHLAKFQRCVTYGRRTLASDTSERVIGLVDRLDELSNSNEIIQALCPVEP
ncbi:MAG: MmgE/PrpD family protein [Symploca sp. SIO2E6]|nr:MmgE/PrpD family protein [Symploca sp. SIO2E6]